MDDSVSQDVFEGFWHPIENKGFTQLPHELFDLMADMGESELRVILYIFRHTWGFQEFGKLKRLSTDDFMKGRKQKDKETGKTKRMDNGTGLSDRGVKDGIAQALAHGYIICEVDDSDLGRIEKLYGIKIFAIENY